MIVSSPQTNEKLTLSQLESFLLKSADISIGSLDASEFKDCIFGMLFLKHIYDAYDEERGNVIQHFLDTGKTLQQAEQFASEQDEYDKTLVKKLVNQFEESSKIVGFFLKQDEIKTMQRNIKRAMIEDEFDDPDLRKIVIERFMELAKVKFK